MLRRALIAVLVTAAAAGLVLPAAAEPRRALYSGTGQRSSVTTGLFDIRSGTVRAPLPSAAVAAQGLTSEVPDAQVTWDSTLGTAKLVQSRGGYLNRPTAGSAEQVARAWLAAHRELFGLDSAAVHSLQVTRDAHLPGTNLDPLVLRVTYGGLATFDGGAIGVNVMPDGRIASVWANTGRSAHLDTHPTVTAARAVATIAKREGVKFTVKGLGQRVTGDRLAIFDAGGLFAPHNARLAAFPTADGPVLAWQVFFAKAGDQLLSTAVDAKTGAILYRSNQVVNAEGKIFKHYPGAEFGGTQEIVPFDGDPAASPQGWVGIAGLPGITTAGNNAISFTDWFWPKLAPGLIALQAAQLNPLPDTMPIAADGKFNYDFADNWGKACDPTTLPQSVPLHGSTLENPSFIQDREASVTNGFYLANKYHDLMYEFGFTEPMGNYQIDNFGKGGKGLDPVKVMAMAGIVNDQVDNAFFFPAPDGGEPTSFIDPASPTTVASYLPAFTGMFLFRPVPGFQALCSDGNQDAEVVWHELTHGLTTRLAGGPDDSNSLNTAQSGAMGEAWSDWFAESLLHRLGLETNGLFGEHVTNNPISGIRNFRLDDNPLTFADLGYDIGGPEVHSDGEIWSATLWDLRAQLVAKYGEIAGGDRALHLVFDALVLAGLSNPSMLDQRDGILKADQVRYGGTDLDMLWKVFAKRGMGATAKTIASDDVHPHPAFDVPGATDGTFTGTVFDADGGVLKAKIILGYGTGDPSPVAISDDTGHYSVKLAPGTYDLTVGAAGYGLQHIGLFTIASGVVHRDFTLSKNLASLGYGAKVISGLAAGELGLALIDDHELSAQVVPVGKPVVIQLGGSGPAIVRRVSIAQRGGGTRSTASAFTVEISVDGTSWSKLTSGGVHVTTSLALIRQFLRANADAAGARARFVRITVTDTVGGKPTDGSAWTATVGGLEVFGSAPNVSAIAVGGEPDFVDHGSIQLANPGGGSGGADASITELAWMNACATPPAPVQGLDAWITQLPPGASDGLHTLRIKNKGGTGTDIDVYFWNADCTAEVGHIATSAADESGPIPGGAKWILNVLYGGTTTGFDVIASTTIERVSPPKASGLPLPVPVPPVVKAANATRLPATGGPNRSLLALGALVLAGVVARTGRRRVSEVRRSSPR